MVKIKGDRSMFIYLAIIDSPEGKLKFEVIYERYKGLMFYTANSVLGDTRDSEDIVHDAFLKIIEIIDEIDDPKSPPNEIFNRFFFVIPYWESSLSC